MRFFIIFLILFLSNCQSTQLNRYVFQKDLMYTVFDIVIYSSAPKREVTSYVNTIWSNLTELEYELSPAGEGVVGNLNRQKTFLKKDNPQMFATVSNFIEISKKINEQSEGAYDLTVYPLIRLWRFYLQDGGQIVPEEADIVKTLQNIGMNHIYVNSEKIFLSNNVQLDLGSIAKGFAVDEALKMIKQNEKISSGFVNAGGNIRVYGQKPDGTPWKVGIRNPNGTSVEEIISLYDGDSISTSGDYEQYFEIDGKYYHHIFNPKTGYPVTHNLASMSVVFNGDAELSDILSTTFLSLGKQKTKDLFSDMISNQNISLFFIERNQKELISEANDSWIKRR